MKHRTGYLFKRGNNFYVSWRVNGKLFMRALRDDNGQPITTKRDAEEARAKVMAPFAVADEVKALESLTGQLAGRKEEVAKWEDKQNPPLTLAQAWGEYMKSTKRPDTGPDTLAVYEGQFGQFVDWIRDQYPSVTTLRGVTEEIAEAYAGHLNHGRLSPNTFNKHLAVLTLVFRILFKKAKLTLNPWADITRKKLNPQHRRELTIDELRRLAGGATGEMRTLIAMGLYTGLRLKDCATLRWSEVDLPMGVIRRVPSKTARIRPEAVKIPIHPTLAGMLSEIPLEDRKEYVLPKTADTYQNHK